jgi:putative nucleotidyltransferase with HDIG domain
MAAYALMSNHPEQRAVLRWAALTELLHSLRIRDERSARHAAAVATFAFDIAIAAGFSARDCELAHAAGLLHDIGRVALSDRVRERGLALTEEDWHAIWRHPEIGAGMLRSFGINGEVAGIVVAHHERIDGRGYPWRLRREQIPELAKVVAVAEVYDTLTGADTYRTPVSSFGALRELRRVAGTQLEPRYVELLADLLGGSAEAYRHANDADFDVERSVARIRRELG